MWLFNNKKEYVSCEELEYGIHFNCIGLYHCCTYFHSKKNDIPVSFINNDTDASFNKFIKQKKIDRDSHRKGKIISRCKGCFLLEKKVWDNSNKIKRIEISANRTCNSKCIYCTPNPRNLPPDEPVYDFIMKLYEKKMLECERVQFGGGEPTLHFEFEKLMDFFLTKTNAFILIHSNCIKYSYSIEQAIKQGRCTLVISIDSGNPELYKKIKNVDKFNDVVENLRKYAIAQKNNAIEPNQVFPKYIIIPDINDSEEQITEFINLAQNIEVMSVRTDIENGWFQQNRYNLSLIRKYLYLFKFMEIKAKEKGLYHFFNDAVIWLINNYKKEYDLIEVK